MDKSKVIDAYFQGLLSLVECAQILGLDKNRLMEMAEYFVECPSLSMG